MSNIRLNAYRFDGQRYSFQNPINVAGAPADADWSRWAMLYSTETNQGTELFRLYCFKKGTNDVIYQFGFNRGARQYEYGYQSTTPLRITGVGPTVNTSTFNMLHDGVSYRMYFQDSHNDRLLHQYVWNGREYQVEDRTPTLNLQGLPANADMRKTAMCYAKGSNLPGYHFYTVAQGTDAPLIQLMFKQSARAYVRINDVGVNIAAPVGSNFALAGSTDAQGGYWFYTLEGPGVPA